MLCCNLENRYVGRVLCLHNANPAVLEHLIRWLAIWARLFQSRHPPATVLQATRSDVGDRVSKRLKVQSPEMEQDV